MFYLKSSSLHEYILKQLTPQKIRALISPFFQLKDVARVCEKWRPSRSGSRSAPWTFNTNPNHRSVMFFCTAVTASITAISPSLACEAFLTTRLGLVTNTKVNDDKVHEIDNNLAILLDEIFPRHTVNKSVQVGTTGIHERNKIRTILNLEERYSFNLEPKNI